MTIAKNKVQPGEWTFDDAEAQAQAIESLDSCPGWRDYLLPYIAMAIKSNEDDALGDRMGRKARERARHRRNALKDVLDRKDDLLLVARERMEEGRALEEFRG